MALSQPVLPCKAPPLVIFQAERLWRSVAGFGGLLIHCVPGTAPAFLSLPPVYKFIKYPQGSQSPAAREGSREVIHIAEHTVSEGPAGFGEG